jgi:hypothetical protein
MPRACGAGRVPRSLREKSRVVVAGSAPSSSGLGRRPLKAVAPVRIRSGLPSTTSTTRPLTSRNEGQRPCCVSDRVRSGPAVGERVCPLRARVLVVMAGPTTVRLCVSQPLATVAGHDLCSGGPHPPTHEFGLGRSGWAWILFSPVGFGPVRPGGMTARMTSSASSGGFKRSGRRQPRD